jgi:hypothetical protein
MADPFRGGIERVFRRLIAAAALLFNRAGCYGTSGELRALGLDRDLVRARYSSSGAPPPLRATSSCFTRSTLNFCAFAMIRSSVSSYSNDAALENLV